MKIRSRPALTALLAALVLCSAAARADVSKCSREQQAIAKQIEAADHKSALAHVKANFTPKGSYLVNDSTYQNYVKGKTKLGRPQGADSYLFVAGGKFIDGVLRAAKKADGTTDFGVIEHKLGLPPNTYPPTGGLWRVDVNVPISCYRLPRASDPGANPQFKAGGFTSGGVPEILVLNGRPSHAEQIVKKGVQRPPRPTAANTKKAPARRP